MRRPRGEDGNALVEFSVLGVLLLVPLTYVVITVAQVQRAAFAATEASRAAGRTFVVSGGGDAGERRAKAAAALALRDQGLALPPGALVIGCDSEPCLTAGSAVHVSVDLRVALPFLPAVLEGRAPASIAVHGRHVEVVDCFVAAARSGSEECP